MGDDRRSQNVPYQLLGWDQRHEHAVGIIAEPALATIIAPLFANTALASAGVGAILAFVTINLLHLTHGEQTPTYLGVERTKFVAKYGAAPLYWFALLLSPVIWLDDAVAK